MAEVKVFNPLDLNPAHWTQLHYISQEAFSDSLVYRNQEEIDILTSLEDVPRFIGTHVAPNTLIGKEFNPNQSFSKLRVAVARDEGKTVGWAYGANNVSGKNSIIRAYKHLPFVNKNYFWLREVAVRPDYQQRGIAKKLGRALLESAAGYQPVSAYVWPDEIDFIQGALERYGFSATGEQLVPVFGEENPPVRQVRMQAPSASSVLQKLG